MFVDGDVGGTRANIDGYMSPFLSAPHAASTGDSTQHTFLEMEKSMPGNCGSLGYHMTHDVTAGAAPSSCDDWTILFADVERDVNSRAAPSCREDWTRRLADVEEEDLSDDGFTTGTDESPESDTRRVLCQRQSPGIQRRLSPPHPAVPGLALPPHEEVSDD